MYLYLQGAPHSRPCQLRRNKPGPILRLRPRYAEVRLLLHVSPPQRFRHLGRQAPQAGHRGTLESVPPGAESHRSKLILLPVKPEGSALDLAQDLAHGLLCPRSNSGGGESSTVRVGRGFWAGAARSLRCSLPPRPNSSEISLQDGAGRAGRPLWWRPRRFLDAPAPCLSPGRFSSRPALARQ